MSLTLPVSDAVRGVCELLGLDALHVANEGKLLAIVPGADADAALGCLRRHPLGASAAMVGEVVAGATPRVLVRSAHEKSAGGRGKGGNLRRGEPPMFSLSVNV